jgi:hypothetical protein
MSNAGVVPLIFALTYFVFIVLVALITRIDPLDNRLLSPSFAPLAMSLFATAGGLRSEAVIRRSLRRRAALGTLLVLVLLGRSTLFGVRYIPNAAASPPPFGYTSDPENPSLLVRWVTDYDPPWKIYTNDPLQLYAVAHVRAKYAPLQGSPESMRRFSDAVAKEEVMLVWFKKSFQPSVGLNRLKKEFDLRTLTTQKDGAAYLVRPLKKPK